MHRLVAFRAQTPHASLSALPAFGVGAHLCSIFRRKAAGGKASVGPSKQEQQELDDAARRRFGNAKSISSSQYNNEDESANAFERDSRLQRFQVHDLGKVT